MYMIKSVGYFATLEQGGNDEFIIKFSDFPSLYTEDERIECVVNNAREILELQLAESVASTGSIPEPSKAPSMAKFVSSVEFSSTIQIRR